MKAIVLAAGLATRMRPLSDHIPKPLLPILGKPLLGRILENLAAVAAEPIVVNTHHLAAAVERFVGGLSRPQSVTLSHEPKILGSGGALVKAREILASGEYFIYHNGDELTDLDIGAVLARHREAAAAGRAAPLATLALADYGPENKVLASKEGEVLDIIGALGAAGASGSRTLAFTGIAVISREIFDYLPSAGPSSVMQALLKAMHERAGCVRAHAAQEIYWSNVEDVDRYLDVHRDILVKRKLRLKDAPEGPVYISAGASVSPRARLSGFVSVGPRAAVAAGAVLEDSVVLADAVVAAGDAHRRAVIGPDFFVKKMNA